MMPVSQPQTSSVIDGQPGNALVVRAFRQKSSLQIGGRPHHLAVYQTAHAHRPFEIKGAARIACQPDLGEFGARIILAPLFVAFLVGDPEAILLVASETGAGFKTRGAGNHVGFDVRAGKFSDMHVVVVFFIRIVADVDLADGIGGDRGIPGIGRGLGHLDFRLRQVNGLIIADGQLARQDLPAPFAPRLPGQPDLARSGSGGHDVVVGAGIAGQPLDGGPFPHLPCLGRRRVDPMIDIPVAVDLLAPGNMHASLGDGHGGAPDVQAVFGHVDGSAPGRAVVCFEANLIAVALGHERVEVAEEDAFGDVRSSLGVFAIGQPQRAPLSFREGGIIVFRRPLGQAHDAIFACHGDAAQQIRLRGAGIGQVAEGEVEVALLGRNLDARRGGRIDRDAQCRRSDPLLRIRLLDQRRLQDELAGLGGTFLGIALADLHGHDFAGGRGDFPVPDRGILVFDAKGDEHAGEVRGHDDGGVRGRRGIAGFGRVGSILVRQENESEYCHREKRRHDATHDNDSRRESGKGKWPLYIESTRRNHDNYCDLEFR